MLAWTLMRAEPSLPISMDVLVERVHAAAEAPSLLPVVLREIRLAVGARGIHVTINGEQAALHQCADGAVHERQLVCRERVGMLDVALTLSFDGAERDESLWRSAADVGAALAWHFAQAFGMQHTLHTLRAQISELRHVLDHVATPLLVVDAHARIEHSNAAARACLTRGEALRACDGRLVAARHDEHRALVAAVARTVQVPGSGPLVLEISRDHAKPLGILVLPFDKAGLDRVLVLLHDVEATAAIDAAWLQQLCGLTRTERILVEALAAGLTVQEFAASRDCSEHTARSHLKRVQEKTGARRQPELVRMLASAPALCQPKNAGLPGAR